MSRLNDWIKRASLSAQRLTSPDSAKLPLTLFLHVPSTGGTTMHSIFEMLYGADRAKRLEEYNDAWRYVVETLRDRPFTVDGIVAHTLLYHRPHTQARDVRLITLLRDPAERVFSAVYRIKSTPTHNRHAEYNDIDDPVTLVQLQRDNAEVRHIAGVGFKSDVTSADLEEAKRRLREWFVVVGLTERYDESLLLMKRKLGWSKLPVYQRKNTGEARKPRQLPQEAYDAVRERNPYDYALYDYAKGLFEAQLAAEPADFAEEYAAFRRALGKD
jgi:hypothetical protein